MMKIIFFSGLLLCANFCQAQTNILPNSGNVGIGTVSPKVLLDVSKIAENDNSETLMRFSVSDAIGQDLSIQNYTAINGKFIPLIVSQSNRNDSYSLGLMSVLEKVSLDQGSIPMIRFDARVQSEALKYRPLFSWGSYTNDYMTMLASGNLGIGTSSPEHKLDIVGTARAHQIIVNTQKTADFVFAPDYKNLSLEQIDTFITTNKHLPGIQSAAQMEKEGLNVGQFQIDLLQKIEELTLHLIEKNKEMKDLKENMKVMQQEIDSLKRNK